MPVKKKGHLDQPTEEEKIDDDDLDETTSRCADEKEGSSLLFCSEEENDGGSICHGFNDDESCRNFLPISKSKTDVFEECSENSDDHYARLMSAERSGVFIGLLSKDMAPYRNRRWPLIRDFNDKTMLSYETNPILGEEHIDAYQFDQEFSSSDAQKPRTSPRLKYTIYSKKPNAFPKRFSARKFSHFSNIRGRSKRKPWGRPHYKRARVRARRVSREYLQRRRFPSRSPTRSARISSLGYDSYSEDGCSCDDWSPAKRDRDWSPFSMPFTLFTPAIGSKPWSLSTESRLFLRQMWKETIRLEFQWSRLGFAHMENIDFFIFEFGRRGYFLLWRSAYFAVITLNALAIFFYRDTLWDMFLEFSLIEVLIVMLFVQLAIEFIILTYSWFIVPTAYLVRLHYTTFVLKLVWFLNNSCCASLAVSTLAMAFPRHREIDGMGAIVLFGPFLLVWLSVLNVFYAAIPMRIAHSVYPFTVCLCWLLLIPYTIDCEASQICDLWVFDNWALKIFWLSSVVASHVALVTVCYLRRCVFKRMRLDTRPVHGSSPVPYSYPVMERSPLLIKNVKKEHKKDYLYMTAGDFAL